MDTVIEEKKICLNYFQRIKSKTNRIKWDENGTSPMVLSDKFLRLRSGSHH